MEALAEQLIATYLTRGGKVFLAPQYSVPGDEEHSEWSCPDFVALSFEKAGEPEVIIVEVTTAPDPSNLIRKLKQRENQWHDRIRAKLIADGIISDRWSFRFLSFVRRHNLEKCQRSFSPADNVFFAALEDATFSWEYWDKRLTQLPWAHP